MQQALNQFKKNIKDVRDLDTRYVQLTQAIIADDFSDLLRAEIVYAISALDKFIHELIRIGMIEIYKGSRTSTSQYDSFQVSLRTVSTIQDAINQNATGVVGPPPESYFEQEIITKHSHLAFQDPDKINVALNLVSDKPHKWQNVANDMGISDADLKTELKNIVGRRNAIVHEADLDIQTGNKNTILHSDALTMIDFIEKLGEGIYNYIH